MENKENGRADNGLVNLKQMVSLSKIFNLKTKRQAF